MSWVDVAGLVFILWGAAKGYLKGALKTTLHLFLLVMALPVAYAFSRPVAHFLNDQWPLEAIFVGWLGRGLSLETSTQAPPSTFLPPLSGKFLWRLLPPQEVLPVAKSGLGLQVTAALMLRFLVLVTVFIFLVFLARYCLELYTFRFNGEKIGRKQNYIGFFCGALYGFVVAVLFCLLLDSLSLFFTTGFWRTDLEHSFLVKAADYVLQYF